jgi:hypothetical protein
MEKIAIVVTSISGPNKVMCELAKGCAEGGHQFVVIGDEASPERFELDGCDFYDLARQRESGFEFARQCPTRHYARKNIGYLVAIKNGAQIIVETDDDNIPYESFWDNRQLGHTVNTVHDSGWVNVYRYFTEANIWPRGFVLESILQDLPEYDSLKAKQVLCPIQQGLADKNPDVDAIYRLTLPIPQSFRTDRRVAIGRGSVCPFNSQNTTWFSQAFALLYLPSYCSFRMTDIWRSFVAQRIAFENEWAVLFHEPTVYQDRNEHDLMKDFADELPGYMNNSRIYKELESLELEAGEEKITANLIKCYQKLIELGLVDAKEMHLLNCWIGHIGDLMKS